MSLYILLTCAYISKHVYIFPNNTYTQFSGQCINIKYILPFKASHALILNFQIKTHPELFSFIENHPVHIQKISVCHPTNRYTSYQIFPIFKTHLTSTFWPTLYTYFSKGRAMCFDVVYICYIYTHV